MRVHCNVIFGTVQAVLVPYLTLKQNLKTKRVSHFGLLLTLLFYVYKHELYTCNSWVVCHSGVVGQGTWKAGEKNKVVNNGLRASACERLCLVLLGLHISIMNQQQELNMVQWRSFHCTTVPGRAVGIHSLSRELMDSTNNGLLFWRYGDYYQSYHFYS